MAKRVLIVDDDKSMAEIINDTLSEYGYEPYKAYCLEDAYETLSKQTVELIILDINLPDGVGFDFCKDLRKYSNVPIIFASARPAPSAGLGPAVPQITAPRTSPPSAPEAPSPRSRGSSPVRRPT